MSKRKWSNDDLKKAVETSFSYREVIQKLNLIPAGGNYRTIQEKVKELNLDISHFTGKAWNQGERYRPIREKQPLDEILVKDSTFKTTFHLKERLFEEGLKEKVCECCGRSEWLGQPIPLELHHINGAKSDLRIENLQILCPNCHAMTDNYRGKVLSAQKEISDVEVG